MTPLFPALPLKPDETTMSLVSRLAHLHGKGEWTFSNDLGVPLKGLSAGDPAVLEKLHWLTGIAYSELERSSFIKQSRGLYAFRGELFPSRALSREKRYVCPRCISSDIEKSPAKSQVDAYERYFWSLACYRKCHIHGVEMVEVASNFGHFKCDPDKRAVCSSVDPVAPVEYTYTRSGLVDYVIGQLKHDPQDRHLRNYSLAGLVKASEYIGILDNKGARFQLKNVTNEEWHAAGARGFEILRQGSMGLHDFFLRLFETYSHREAFRFIRTGLFGPTHVWFKGKGPDQSYFRNLLIEAAAAVLPLGPGDEILGQEIKVRKIHSLQTASLETNVGVERLRSVLIHNGILSREHAKTAPHNCLFEASALTPILSELSDCTVLEDAAEYLGVTPRLLRDMLQRNLLTPVKYGRSTPNRCLFSRVSLDTFIARVQIVEKSESREGKRDCNIRFAANRWNGKIIDIIHAVVDGRISAVRIDKSKRGVQSLYFDPDTVSLAFGTHDVVGISRTVATNMLKARWKTICALMENKFLPYELMTNPYSKRKTRRILEKDISLFSTKYVSLSELSEARSENPQQLLAKFRRNGVNPDICPKLSKGYFYLRERQLHLGV